VGEKGLTSDYKLVWREEFNGTELNTQKLYPKIGNIYWSYDPKKVSVSNGNLILTAAKENGDVKYGGVLSKGKYSFMYGYIEIRAKVVKGNGFLSGLWMTGQYNWPPEIDIIEHLGKEPNAIHMNRHCNTNNDATCDGKSFLGRTWWKTKYLKYIGSDWSSGYHTYGMEWTPKYVKWIIDGVERFNITTGVPKEPMWITLSLCADNCAGGWSGPVDSTTILPNKMYVDYVRVYQKGQSYTGVIVISPNGGEILERGVTKKISWNSGNAGQYVKVELLKNGILNKVISPNTPNDGSHYWTIPLTQMPGTDYKIKITSSSNSVHTDTSNGNFVISPISVVYPNGGNSWIRGTTNTIKWGYTGNSGTYVKIELFKGGVFNRLISSSTPNDGSYSWTIPLTQTIGTDYKIKVTSTSNSVYNDWSNNYFRIY
jgi:beta-glucanase (GH16 family)